MNKLTLPDSRYALTKQVMVNSYHSDLNGKLAIPSIFAFFQEIAWEHATQNGFGFNDLKLHNSFWVLSRIHIEIEKLPKWTDGVTLTTWPSGIEGPFALRDFVFSNETGETLIKATSSWLIVDATLRRPKRPDTYKSTMPIYTDIRATQTNAPKIIVSQGQAIAETQHKVGVCDLDVNGHINNVKYTEWALNLMPHREYKENPICCIDVNYLAEGFYGDSCIHKLQRINSNCLMANITRVEDNKALALISINQKNAH
ncbi:MAG: acyl-ACP thioesterase domain-containing protein [Bacteroidales bacterium]